MKPRNVLKLPNYLIPRARGDMDKVPDGESKFHLYFVFGGKNINEILTV